MRDFVSADALLVMGTAHETRLSMKAVPLSIEPSAGSEPADARPTIRSCRVPFPRRALRRGCVLRVPPVRRTASLGRKRCSARRCPVMGYPTISPGARTSPLPTAEDSRDTWSRTLASTELIGAGANRLRRRMRRSAPDGANADERRRESARLRGRLWRGRRAVNEGTANGKLRSRKTVPVIHCNASPGRWSVGRSCRPSALAVYARRSPVGKPPVWCT